jgi:hypothetical protein
LSFDCGYSTSYYFLVKISLNSRGSFAIKFKRCKVHPDGTVFTKLRGIELENIENMCIKCKRKISEHPATGRFNTIVLYGPECAWDPDNEWKEYVVNLLKISGYNIEDFGYNEYSPSMK